MSVVATAAVATDMPRADRIRIAEARRIADRFGDNLWPGWSAAPFAILLVTPDVEYLVYHAAPSDDFEPVGYDSLLGSEVYTRPRQFDTGLLATFPAVGGVPTIVIGQPKNTEASHSTRWVLTLLHEHFHQWQMSQEDYYQAVDGLGLSGGDASGSWMLDYPFPYESHHVGDAFLALAKKLADAVSCADADSFAYKVSEYRVARDQFRQMIAPGDYRYFSFQLWQEGIARYTEYRLAKMAAAVYEPSRDFKSLRDYVPFEEQAKQAETDLMTKLVTASLGEEKRSAFYAFGAAEGLLFDRYYPWWKQHYLEHKFFLERYYDLRPY